MAARITTERVLRDEEDSSGQSIREWKIESEPGFITIRLKHGDGFILLRSGDVGTFTADLERARALAMDLATDKA